MRRIYLLLCIIALLALIGGVIAAQEATPEATPEVEPTAEMTEAVPTEAETTPDVEMTEAVEATAEATPDVEMTAEMTEAVPTEAEMTPDVEMTAEMTEAVEATAEATPDVEMTPEATAVLVPIPEYEEIPCTERALAAAIEAQNLNSIVFPDNCVITLSGDLPPVTKPFNIDGNLVVIDGMGKYRPFHVQAGGALSLDYLTIQNTNAVMGSAVYIGAGRAQISRVLFQNNRSYGEFGGGAVTITSGDVTLINSTFYNNSAATLGGAVTVLDGDVELVNVIFHANSAARGGALAVLDGEVIVTANTISGNHAQEGGGILKLREGTLSIAQSIVGGNNAARYEDISQIIGMTSEGYNLFTSTDFFQPFEILPTDLLVVETGLGAFTGTVIPLTAGSPALDAIPEAECATGSDERLVSRPQGDACDIGAIEMEFEDGELVTLPGEVGDCSLNGPEVRTYEGPPNLFCRVLMRDGAYVANPGSVAPEVVDQGVILAVDFFRIEGGDIVQGFDNPLPVCLRGDGQLIYLDATEQPRTPEPITSLRSGLFTCGVINGPGTVALVFR